MAKRPITLKLANITSFIITTVTTLQDIWLHTTNYVAAAFTIVVIIKVSKSFKAQPLLCLPCHKCERQAVYNCAAKLAQCNKSLQPFSDNPDFSKLAKQGCQWGTINYGTHNGYTDNIGRLYPVLIRGTYFIYCPGSPKYA
jgi:uncharacterized Fe-S cluster-containing MiaB family protein